jgi:tetratricopeptide (TPR) repeat protein
MHFRGLGWGQLPMITPRLASIALVFFMTISPTLAEAPRGYIARPLEAGVDYNQRARDAYAAGVWTLDEIAASEPTPGGSETKHIYERAKAAFEEAVRAEPSMYEAHTYLGYVHRKLGRFDESLKAYEVALKLKPNYVFAIEYQGEAFLGLGDIKRARFNYLRLYALDRELAAQLLEAIEKAEKRRAPFVDCRSC